MGPLNFNSLLSVVSMAYRRFNGRWKRFSSILLLWGHVWTTLSYFLRRFIQIYNTKSPSWTWLSNTGLQQSIRNAILVYGKSPSWDTSFMYKVFGWIRLMFPQSSKLRRRVIELNSVNSLGWSFITVFVSGTCLMCPPHYMRPIKKLDKFDWMGWGEVEVFSNSER